MNINELTREERERLGIWKSWLTYYIYLLKHRNGIFSLDKLKRDLADYAAKLGAGQKVPIEIFGVQDFLAVERILWQFVEQIFAEKKGAWTPMKYFDPKREIEATGTLKGWYIANKEEHMIFRRFCLENSLEEVKESLSSAIYTDVKMVNEIKVVQKIPLDYIDNIITQLSSAYDFDEMEILLENICGQVWDSIQPIVDTLHCELEKADFSRQPAYPYDLEYGARFPGRFDAYCREEIRTLGSLLEACAEDGNKSALAYMWAIGHPDFPKSQPKQPKHDKKANPQHQTKDMDVSDFYDR